MSNRGNPTNPLWNCCQDAPASVGEYANGSAVVVCKSCAFHFSKGQEGKSLHPLPAGWKPATPVDFRIRLAEQALDMYRSFAHSDDSTFAGSWTDNYTNARFTLLACIINAYGDELKAHGATAEDVYNLTIDSGENVAYCVKWAVEHPEDLPFRV